MTYSTAHALRACSDKNAGQFVGGSRAFTGGPNMRTHEADNRTALALRPCTGTCLTTEVIRCTEGARRLPYTPNRNC